MQLNVSNDFPSCWVFANILRTCEVMIKRPYGQPVLTDAEATQLADSLTVDASGWPTTLPSGCEIFINPQCVTGKALDSNSGQMRTTYLTGVFVLTWEGSGTVELDSGLRVGRRFLQSTANRIVMCIDDPFQNEIINVTASDPSNPVRNMRLWAPAYDGAGITLTSASDLAVGHITGNLEPAAGQPEPLFHPLYLAHLREMPDAKVVRFLQWQEINDITDATPVTWADRTPATYEMRSLPIIGPNWTRYPVKAFKNRMGFSFEVMIDLCNELGRDIWLQVPHTSTPDVWSALPVLVGQRLDPTLRVWAEYSNEIWNTFGPYLPQRTQAEERAAQHFNVPRASLTFEQVGWGAGQLQADFLQAFQTAWRQAGQSDARLINVAAGFAVSASYNRAVVESMAEVDPQLPEVLAITNYFGAGVVGELYAAHPFGTNPGVYDPTLMDEFAEIVRRSLPADYAAWLQSGQLAREKGLPLVSYEGGQHLVALGLGSTSDPVFTDFTNFLQTFLKSSQMGQLLRDSFAIFSAAGARMPSQFPDVKTWSIFGMGGAKENILETRAQSTQWDVVCAWGESQRGVRAPGDALGTAPALTSAVWTGAVSQPFLADVTAQGGDGAVTVSLLGGMLPSGVTFSDLGGGTARLSGTPTQSGSFFIVLRAKDADGDIDDEVFTFTVDPAGLASSSVVVFRGTDIPASTGLPNNLAGGRYDPVRSTQTLDSGDKLVLPFSTSQALFSTEYGGTQTIAADSSSNVYGGWTVRALQGATRVGAAQLSTFTGLRNAAFTAACGDSNGPTQIDALLLWKKSQFTAPGATWSFGTQAAQCTLQADLTQVVSDGSNEVRFVVVNRESGQDQYYISEHAWTQSTLGDGIFSLELFDASSTAGKRWAPFVPTTGAQNEVVFPTGSLSYGPVHFGDVQAVGLMFKMSRFRYHYSFSFNRFFALGAR